jgi:hypothetical protein
MQNDDPAVTDAERDPAYVADFPDLCWKNHDGMLCALPVGHEDRPLPENLADIAQRAFGEPVEVPAYRGLGRDYRLRLDEAEALTVTRAVLASHAARQADPVLHTDSIAGQALRFATPIPGREHLGDEGLLRVSRSEADAAVNAVLKAAGLTPQV